MGYEYDAKGKSVQKSYTESIFFMAERNGADGVLFSVGKEGVLSVVVPLNQSIKRPLLFRF